MVRDPWRDALTLDRHRRPATGKHPLIVGTSPWAPPVGTLLASNRCPELLIKPHKVCLRVPSQLALFPPLMPTWFNPLC